MPVFPLLPVKVGPNGPSRKRHLGWSIALDIFLILALLVASLMFYRYVMPTVAHFRINDPELLYPATYINVSSPLVGSLSFFVPLVVIILFNILFWWNPWDIYAGSIGLLFAWSVALFFTGLLWVVMGGLRPFFLSKCDIDYTKISSSTLYYTSEQVCRNHDEFVPDDFHGFPSGHGSSAFVGFGFLAFWLNGKVKVNRGGGHVWKGLVFIGPLAIAMWLALKRLSDHSHSEIQMFWGIVVGIVSAMFAYSIFYVEGFWFGYGDNAHIPAIQADRLRVTQQPPPLTTSDEIVA